MKSAATRNFLGFFGVQVGALVGTLALLASAMPCAAQQAPARPTAGVRVQLLLDQRRVAEAKKKVAPDADFPVYAYTMRAGNPNTELRLDSPELIQRWKGDFVLGGDFNKSGFESATQFLPAMLVLDLTNESRAPQQVASAYLAVDSSVSDRQPFMQLQSYGSDSFDLRNFGWAKAENAQLSFAFGRQQPATGSFTLALGSFGALEVSAKRVMTGLVPGLPNWQDNPPRCRSMAQVPTCFAQLQTSSAAGRLADMAYVRDDRVLTRLIGKLNYQWRDAAGTSRPREHPVNVELDMFRFNVTQGAEMGAPAPEETGFSIVMLGLDRTAYRVPLPYRPRIGAGENARFQLALAAPRSSSHVFRVVLEMTDGSRVESSTVDWLYFMPLFDLGETRQVR